MTTGAMQAVRALQARCHQESQDISPMLRCCRGSSSSTVKLRHPGLGVEHSCYQPEGLCPWCGELHSGRYRGRPELQRGCAGAKSCGDWKRLQSSKVHVISKKL
eukprot:1160759-Pelagomonas_calceolata.AAC.8